MRRFLPLAGLGLLAACSSPPPARQVVCVLEQPEAERLDYLFAHLDELLRRWAECRAAEAECALEIPGSAVGSFSGSREGRSGRH